MLAVHADDSHLGSCVWPSSMIQTLKATTLRPPWVLDICRSEIALVAGSYCNTRGLKCNEHHVINSVKERGSFPYLPN